MTVFADSSALVKRYADEHQHDVVRSITQPLAVSALARVEVPSALWRKYHQGEMGLESVGALVGRFVFDWHGDSAVPPAFAAVDLTGSVLEEAADHVARHRLRALDAVQLASALAVRRVDRTTTFAAFDAALRAAAVAEGFALIPASVDPDATGR